MKFRRLTLLLHIIGEIKFPVLSIIGLVGLGTYLFHYFESPYYASQGQYLSYGASFYYVIVVLTTIGFGDIVAHTREGRIVTVSLIIVGIGLISLAFNSITRRIIRSAIDLEFQYQRLVDGYSDHIIVAGYSEVGQRVSKLLKSWKLDLVIIDHDPEKVSRARADGFHALTGDVSDLRELERVGIKVAQGIVLAIEDPNITLFTAKASRVLRENPEEFWVVTQSSTSVTPELYKSAEVNYSVDMFESTRKRMFGILTGVNIEDLNFTFPDGIGFYRIPNFLYSMPLSKKRSAFFDILDRNDIGIHGLISGEHLSVCTDRTLIHEGIDELLVSATSSAIRKLSYELEQEFVHEDRDKRLIIAGYGNFTKSILETAFNYADEILIIDVITEGRKNVEIAFEEIRQNQIETSLQIIREIEKELGLLKNIGLQKQLSKSISERISKEEVRILESIVKEDMETINEIEERIQMFESRPVLSMISDSLNIEAEVQENLSKTRHSIKYLVRQKRRLGIKIQIAQLNIAKILKKDPSEIKILAQKLKKLDTEDEREIVNDVLGRETSYLLMKFIQSKLISSIPEQVSDSKKEGHIRRLLLKLKFEHIHLDRIRNTVLRIGNDANYEDFINVDKLILTSQSAGTMAALALRALEVNPEVEIFARATDSDHVKIFHSISKNIIVLSPEVSCASQLSSGVLQNVFNSRIVLFSNGQLLFSDGDNTFSNFSLIKREVSIASYRREPVGFIQSLMSLAKNLDDERRTYYGVGARDKKHDWELKFAEY